MKKVINSAGRTVTIFCDEGAKAQLPVVFLNAVQNEGGAVYERCKELGAKDFVLVSVGIEKWNEDMSPWKAEPVMKGGEAFAGGADRYLKEMILDILPEVEKELPAKPLYYALAGYSLGGLFALYSVYHTDIFAKIASASGSLWFPGFVEYAAEHKIKANVKSVYISLGKLESKTRNPILSKVDINTKQLVERYRAEGIDVVYEENNGNHFCQPELRMAKGIAQMIH